MTPKQQSEVIKKFRSRFGILGRLLNKMELSELATVLNEDEKIEAMIYGLYRGALVLMVATDQRLHFIDKRIFSSRIEDYHYLHIESVEYDQSLISGTIKIRSSNGHIRLTFAPTHLIKPFIRVVEKRIQENKLSNTTKTKMQRRVDELERLAKLHQKGYLTDTEFEQQKSKIINAS